MIIMGLFVASNVITGQTKVVETDVSDRVYFIGEDEKKYEKLVEKYKSMLFTVCDNNMDVAYDHWTTLLKDFEAFAEKNNVDVKGVKLWMNVFWAKNGSIDYIVFYPKPNSKNMNYDNVKTLLAKFALNYQSSVKHTTGFSHYGSAAFPIISRAVIGPEKWKSRLIFIPLCL
jgi:hypothetical protein